MARIFKILAFLVAGFVGLFVLAAVALYVFFDPNDFREDISAAVKERTGRELVIEGDISLQLFPWLAVEIGRTSLGDTAGFGDAPIASLQSAKFSIRLLPVLFRQDIIIGAADVESLQMNLKVDKQGRSNWSSLFPEETGEVSETADAGSGDIDINRVDIVNATISYSNAESGELYVIDDFNFHVGRLTNDGSPVPLAGDMRFELQPTGLSGDVEFATNLAIDADTGVFVFDGIDVEGAMVGVASTTTDIGFSTGRVEIASGESTVSMESIDLAVLGMHIRADVQPFTYEGRVTPKATIVVDEFSPRSIMALFDVEPPATADPNVLSRVSIEGSAQLQPTAIELSDITIKLDESTFTGAMSVPRVPTGAYQFDLVGDAIDLERYMEPPVEADEGSSAESAPVEIPADIIKPLNARGELKIKRATLGDIVFDNINLGFNANAGKLRLFPLTADLFGGSYNGDVKIDVAGATPKLSVNEKIAGVNLASLAKAMFDQDNVTGTIDGTFTLSGSGNDSTAIQRDLGGTMSFKLEDGTFEGTDVWYELRRARALLKGEEPPEPKLPPTTDFSSITATGVVVDGIMRNDDLFAALPHMQLTGSGTIDLLATTLDYGMSARILERPEFLEGATAEELDEYTEAVIPMRITGPLASPKIKPDVEKLLRQRVEEEIKDKIEDKLEDKLKDLFKR